MNQYLSLIKDVLESADDLNEIRADRTGVGTISVFGRQLRFDLSQGFPLLTTKKIHTKSVIHELLWFLNGETNIKYLKDNKVRIWDEWADENGDLGPVYGKQWRNWQGSVDQIANVINQIKTNPNSRRHVVISYNPADLPEVAPPACHTLFQFYVDKGKISCQLYQRSADLMLGVPFNIASYSMLLMMVAQVCDLEPHEFVHTFGDVHIYSNHIEGALEQIKREPTKLPTLEINPDVKNIFDFKYEDFKIKNYAPQPLIKFDIAV